MGETSVAPTVPPPRSATSGRTGSADPTLGDRRGQHEHVRDVARSGALSLAGAGASAAAGLLLVGAITNGFDKTTAGTIFVTTSSFLILLSVVQLGTEVGLVRWLPLLMAQGRQRQVKALLLAAALPVLVASALAAAAVVIAAPQLADLIAPDADREVMTAQLRVLAPLLAVGAALNVLLAATRGLRSMLPTVVVEALGRSVVQLVAVVVALLAGLGPVGVVVAWALPYLAALPAAAVWLLALLGKCAPDWRRGGAEGRGDVVRGFWRFTGPRAIGTTSQAVLKRLDIVLVGALQSPAEAALYAAATRFVVVGQLGVQALQQALGPHLSAHFAGDDGRAAQDVYRATTAWAMLLAWPTYLAAAATAPLALSLFGEGYDAVAPVVVILCLAMLVATACGAVDTVLLMSGHPWLSLGNNVLALLLNLTLNLVLIPTYGALGAGIAWAVAIVVRNLLPLVQIAVLHRVSPVGPAAATAAVLSVVCFGLAPLALHIASADTGWVLVALAGGTACFAGAVWHRRDTLAVGMLLDVVSRRRRRPPGRR